VQRELWKNGKLNRHLIARDMEVLAKAAQAGIECTARKDRHRKACKYGLQPRNAAANRSYGPARDLSD
jgi:hypothetical protein